MAAVTDPRAERTRCSPPLSLPVFFVCQLNILEAAGPNDLPTAETCFFNLNCPLYRDYATLFAKLNMAITHCSSINS